MPLIDSQNLLKACADNNLELVQLSIGNCQNVNFEGGPYSCLHYACRNGNLEIAELLINKGADIKIETNNCWGDSNEGYHTFDAMLIACRYGHLDIVKLLKSKGCDINNKYNKIPSYRDSINFSFGAYCIEKFNTIPSSLHLLYSCKSGNHKLVEFLIENGAKCENQNGKDLLMFYACKYGNYELVILLLKFGATFNNKYYLSCVDQNHEPTSLHYLIKYNRILILRNLIKNNVRIFEYDKFDNTFFKIACEHSSIEVIKFLCHLGCDINKMFNNESYPIHSACKRFYKELVKELIVLGAEANRKNASNITPLHICCGKITCANKSDEYSTGDNLIIANLLIDHGANINEVDDSGNTALHIACKNFQIAIMQKLISKGANVNAKNNDGKSSLHIICTEKSNARYNEKENKYEKFLEEDLLIINLLLKSGAKINDIDTDGNTPLHIACKSRYKDIVNLLLLNKANVDFVNNEGDSPLHLVCTTPEDDWLIVKNLILNGANVSLKNNQGNSPLHIACTNCNVTTFGGFGADVRPTFETIKLLLKNKSNPREKNFVGESSLKIAYRRRLDNQDIEQFKFMHDYRCKKDEELHLFDFGDYEKCTDLESSWSEIADDEIMGMDEDFPDWRLNID